MSAHAPFVSRHIGPSPAEQEKMLKLLGFSRLDDFVDAVVPQDIRRKEMRLPAPLSEREALAALQKIANKNQVFRSLIGQGYYGTVVPPVILRNVLENPAWYTSYTPYQPEISQGRLEALLNFQTMVCDLTGMEIANASLLDEATAAAEAMMLARRQGKAKSNVFLVDQRVHPQTIDVLLTRAGYQDIEIAVVDCKNELPQTEYFGVLVQYPDTHGHVADYRGLAEIAHANGAVLVVATDLLALTILTPPGEWNADIVVGNAQRFGVPLGFGGPHAAFMATRDSFKRAMPGRLQNVFAHSSGGGKLLAVMQFKKITPADEGRQRQAALLAFSAFPELKHVILVDEDVDIFDTDDVLWAMQTRYQGDNDTIFIPGVRCHPLDPSQSPAFSNRLIQEGTSCKTIFDCTVPLHLKEHFQRCKFMEVDVKRFLPDFEA